MTTRRMIIGAGALMAGTALGSLAVPAAAQGSKAESWPWPYEKLDPEETAEICYQEWYRVFCGAAIISSIFVQLRKKVGEPYISFPIDAFVYLEGGQAEWGTICGGPAAANMVANLILGPRTGGSAASQLCDRIMRWYSETPLPVYLPKQPRVAEALPTTISSSPLCHVSVGKWMQAANKSLRSPERKDRCARVGASMAWKLTEFLNAWKDGQLGSSTEFRCDRDRGIPSQPNCNECHGSSVTAPFVRHG